jgi:hypothetical protein
MNAQKCCNPIMLSDSATIRAISSCGKPFARGLKAMLRSTVIQGKSACS